MKIIVKRHKFDWYWAPSLILVWSILFVAIIWWHQEDQLPPSSNHKTFLEDYQKSEEQSDYFLQQRSQELISRYERFGAKVVGSSVNEQMVIQFLLNEIKQIKMLARHDLYDVQEEVRYSSGNFITKENFLNYYQGIQYIVIKVESKSSEVNSDVSDSSLLINCHYDTVIGSLGAGSSGAMVVVVLETLRHLLQTEHEPFKHSLIFLFNGAKENELQGIHAFITHHRWALNVKAAINLDSLGIGGREMLLRSHSNSNSWLLKYYCQYSLYPFASTFLEEFIQQKWLPLENDYDLLHQYNSKLDLLDISYVYGGHIYHTKYDRANVIPKATVQRTTANLLAIIEAIINAPEMSQTESENHNQDQHIFFDFFGWFIISYSTECAIWLNVALFLVYLVLLGIFLYITAPNTGMLRRRVLLKFSIILAIQLVSVLLAIITTVIVMCFLDIVDLNMVWYSRFWLALGLYAAPMLFIMGIIPATYLSRTKDHGLPLSYAVQLFMHSHCLILGIILLLGVLFEVRSAFIITISFSFYILSMIINIFTCAHKTNFIWFVSHTICLILPFVFCTYTANVLYSILIPMTGYQNISQNPQILIGGIAIVWCILVGGFLLPSFYLFRKTKTIISIFAVIWIIFIILVTATSIGFPYKPKIAVQRIYIQHTNRIFHDDDPAMTISREDKGFIVIPLVKRHAYLLDHSFGLKFNHTLNNCKDDLMCGLPVYDPRWFKWQKQALWLPANTSPTTKYNRPHLRIISKEQNSPQSITFTLEIFGPDHIGILIQPLPTVKLINWSFPEELLETSNREWLYIYYSYALDASPLRFYMEFEHENADWSGVTFNIVLIGHQIHDEVNYTKEFQELLFRFPSWTHITAWMSSYESWKI